MIIPLFIGILCFIVLMAIVRGTGRELEHTDHEPTVSVVISARNEETLLPGCLKSIELLDYNPDKLRIVLVDHLSDDDTGTIMKQYAESSRWKVAVLHITEEDEELQGKVHALNTALDTVDSEFALITDADCIVPPTWVRSMMEHFTDKMDAVGGLVTVERNNGHREKPVEHMQRVDHWYYLGMMAGLTNSCGPGDDRLCWLNKLPRWILKLTGRFHPAFLIGNNFGLRMSVYREVGGYRAVGFTVIEDYALTNHLVKNSRGNMVMVLGPEARVKTIPLRRLRKLWQQKRRWAAGLRIFNALNTLLFTMIFLIRIAVPWMLLLWPLPSLISLLLIAIGDWVVIKRVSSGVGDKVHTWEILLQEIYQIILNHGLLLAWVVRWPVVWKDHVYRSPR